jgi:phage terminase small subunit
MTRARDPNRDKAHEIWIHHNGQITNREIAKILDVDEKKIAVWKQRDKWNVVQQKGNNVVQQKKKITTKPSKAVKELEEAQLTEKQRLFCLYYVKSFNATQAAIKAGYSPDRAHVTGSELVRNRKVADEIRRIKGSMTQDIFLDAMDVLQKWIKIAFADITDFVQFGKKQSPATNMLTGEMIYDDNGDPVLVPNVEYFDIKNSHEVDGSLISEIKQGREGISIKLADKIKALEKLSLYFDLFPDKFKREVEEEKLKLEHHKIFGKDEQEEYEDDGFEDALKGVAAEVWDDDDED